MEEKNSVGRPEGSYKFSVEDFINGWIEFKEKCDNHMVNEVSAGKVVHFKRPRIYTLAAFQVFLGISRESWGDYRTYTDYSDTIRAIEQEVLAGKEVALVNGEGSTQGIRFDLQVNYGWQDKQVIESKVEVTSVEVKVIPASAMAIATSEKDVDVDK